MDEDNRHYVDGVIRRWLKTMTPQGFAEAKRQNRLNSMTMVDETPVLRSHGGMCAICLDNGYILQADNSHRKCRCR